MLFWLLLLALAILIPFSVVYCFVKVISGRGSMLDISWLIFVSLVTGTVYHFVPTNA